MPLLPFSRVVARSATATALRASCSRTYFNCNTFQRNTFQTNTSSPSSTSAYSTTSTVFQREQDADTAALATESYHNSNSNNNTSANTKLSSNQRKNRLVIAVGGNALQRRGERLTIANMLSAAADMAPALAALLEDNEIVLCHGNGPQVGELALERSAATFDVLGAESIGQIGYVLAQALQSVGVSAVPIITQVVVDAADPSFRNPTKFVGPVYGPKEAHALAESLGWMVKPDGEYFRRVVPSPAPVEILQVDAVRTLLEHSSGTHVLPIACGGGGVPVSRVPSRPQTLLGVEAVIDKDACGSKLASELEADGFVILTDGGGVWRNFGKPDAQEMQKVTPEYLLGTKAGKNFPGSMGPKIEAAIAFVQNSPNPKAWAAIGDLRDAAKILSNEEGTMILKEVDCDESVIWYDRGEPQEPTTPPRLSKDPPKYG